MVWVLLSIIIALILLAVLAIFVKRRKIQRDEEKYYSLFAIGIMWFPLGLLMIVISGSELVIGYFFALVGFFYLLIGFFNRKKWPKDRYFSRLLRRK